MKLYQVDDLIYGLLGKLAVIFKLISRVDILSISYEIALIWKP